MIYMTVRLGNYDRRTRTFEEIDTASMGPEEEVNDVLEGFLDNDRFDAAELVLDAPSGGTRLAEFKKMTNRTSKGKQKTHWRLR